MHWLRSLRERLQPHSIPLAVLCVVTLSVYVPSLRHDFLTNWDDQIYVSANDSVRGFSLAHLRAAFSTFYSGNYAPAQIISYMLDYHIWGMRAAGFILTNILLHLSNGLLYYRLLLMFSFSRLAAALSAFVFLLHPIQVESVVWISQRKNVLAMLLFLASFIFYIHFIHDHPSVKGRIRTYGASLALFTGALLAKAVAVTLPLALLLYDFCYLPASEAKKRLANKAPFLILALLIGITTLVAQQPTTINGGGGRVPFHGGGPLQTALTMMPVILLYFRLLFFPFNLSAIYDPDIKHGIDLQVACAMLVILLLVAVGFRLFTHRRDLAFWYILFFLCLAPVSQIIPLITLINDRYLYFPMLGFAALTGQGISKIYRPLFRAEVTVNARWKKLTFCFLVLPILALPYLTMKRAEVWQNSVTLWTDTAQKVPGIETLFPLAEAYQGRGDTENAKKIVYDILEKNPLHLETLGYLSVVLMQQHDFTSSRRLLLTLTTAYPYNANGFESLGDNYYMTNDIPKAEKNYRKALSINKRMPLSLLALGNILLAKRELREAGLYFSEAIAYGFKSAELYYSLACLKSLEMKLPESLHYLDAALKLGYRNKKSILNNPELGNVRSDKKFNILIMKYLP